MEQVHSREASPKWPHGQAFKQTDGSARIRGQLGPRRELSMEDRQLVNLAAEGDFRAMRPHWLAWCNRSPAGLEPAANGLEGRMPETGQVRPFRPTDYALGTCREPSPYAISSLDWTLVQHTLWWLTRKRSSAPKAWHCYPSPSGSAGSRRCGSAESAGQEAPSNAIAVGE